jgi:hypothetical protein
MQARQATILREYLPFSEILMPEKRLTAKHRGTNATIDQPAFNGGMWCASIALHLTCC